MSEINVSVENRAELEDIVSMLEIHENEIRDSKAESIPSLTPILFIVLL